MDSVKYKRVPQNEGESVNQSPRETITKEKRFNKQKDVCLLFVILIAIVYVLARAGASESSCEQYTGNIDEDVAKFREEKLASSIPHIIECIEAGAGGSQEKCHLSRDKRFLAVNQKGITLWMTGLSGSGKSTIAKALEQKLVLEYGKHVYRLDGDNIRTGLNRDLGFSASDRAESVRRVGELACLFADAGTITMVSLVSPYRKDRDAVRKRHEEQGIKFLEVFMDVPLHEVERRDPKGLYKKARSGEIKGFTGIDDPYEAPLHPDIAVPNMEMTIDECVNLLLRKLKEEGVLIGAPPVSALGLPPPDGGKMINQINPNSPLRQDAQYLRSIPHVLLSDIDLNWAQTIAEGWSSPLAGFMRESVLVQSMHFGSVLFDTFNVTGNADLYSKPSNLSYDSPVIPRDRVSLSLPHILPITDFTKQQIEEMQAKGGNGGRNEVALVTKFGEFIGVLRNPEVYTFRKEEVVTRVWGVIDPGHPYIEYLYSAGDWLLGGEIELFDRIRYHDGLDKYRLSSQELLAEFEKKGADVVFAFQTRNPTHAGHAYLMKTARKQLLDMGYRNPVLWLSPLGGWTKPDDVPLDVRVKQHEAVLESGMLDPETTVMAIWPAPMVYAGPTEVEFHAKSRRSAGASYFVVGRDPAGMKASSQALWNPDDDIYDGDHGKFVLKMSPGMGEMKLLSFSKVYYDKRDHLMRDKDASRPDDFISISGTKMRALARQGAVPCPPTIPSDLLAANCIPPGFMVPAGWNIVVDYYQHAAEADRWVPWSQQLLASPDLGSHVQSKGVLGKRTFKAYLSDHKGSKKISPWHDVPIKPGKFNRALRSSESGDDIFNFVVEIPMFSTAKLEVQKDEPYNPIMQDLNKDGSVRYYTYGTPFFNYGLIPQTWEDSDEVDGENRHGDNDPIDVMEVGSAPLPIGTVTPIRVLGSLELIDEGEVDHKILGIALSDPLASQVHNLDDLERVKPGIIAKLIHWLKFYKTSDGKPPNSLAREEPASKYEAIDIIAHTHGSWNDMMTSHVRFEKGFWTGENDEAQGEEDDSGKGYDWQDARQGKKGNSLGMDDE